MSAELIQSLTDAIVASSSVNAVAFKAPNFWATNAEAWFIRLEASFATHSPPITADKTKFDHVVKLLDSASASKVLAIIKDPPADDKYGALKAGLLKGFERSQFEKDCSLLQMTGLGDRKPSELLQHMQAMNTDPKTLFRALFLLQLPEHVQRIVAREPTSTSLACLADIADRVVELDSTASSSARGVNACSAAPDELDSDDDQAEEPHIAAVNFSRRAGQGARGRGNRRANNGSSGEQQRPAAAAPSSNFALCKFHAKFGTEAIKCSGRVDGKPCAMAGLAGNAKAGAK